MKKKWFNALEALRGLAFISVYVSHSFQYINYYGDWGAIGVEFFFILSGFLSAYFFNADKVHQTGVIRSSFLNLWNKVKKFWPLHAVFVVVAATTHWTGVTNFILNLLLVQSYTGSASIALTFNWPTWFLSSIMISYLLAPLMNLILEKICGKKKTWVPIALMALVFMVQLTWGYLFRNYTKAYDAGYYYVYIFPVARIADFLQGMLLAYVVRAIEQKETQKDYTFIEALFILLFIIECVVYTKIPKTIRYASGWVIPVSLVVGVFALERGKITQKLAQCKSLRYIGSISFELYIIHRMMLYRVSQYSTTVIAWILCSLITLLLAIMSKEIRRFVSDKWKTIRSNSPDTTKKKEPKQRSEHNLTSFENAIIKLRSQKFLFEELVKRDFKQKYKRTVLGMGWSILFPLLQLIVMRLVFTRFFGRNMPYYTTYLFAGNLMFNYFKESTSGSMTALRSNASIFTKINVPKYLFLLSKNVSAVINFGLALIVFFIFAAVDGITFTPVCFAIIYPIACLTLFNIGVGMILSALHVFFRDIQYLYEIFTLLLLYMSAIFYYVDSYPANVQKLFLLNPVYANIKYVRIAVIEATVPSLAYHGLLLLYAVVALGIGALIYKKKNQKFLYYV